MSALHRSGGLRGGLFSLGALALAALVSQCILFPEEQFSGELTANQRPVVRITGGVLEDGEQLHESSVHFYWHGADHDGVIRRFEWAIDDTVTEGAWHRTTEFDEVIPFSAARADTVEGQVIYNDWHAFFVRSVDNEGARSRPEKRHFNARTIAPTTTIVTPSERSTSNKWARELRVTWRGEDLDATSADGLPVAYELKFVEVASRGDLNSPSVMARMFVEAPNRLHGTLDPTEYPQDDDGEYLRQAEVSWLRVPGTMESRWLSGMEISKYYAFAVRSVDEAGACETELLQNINWVGFQASDQNIIVYVNEPSIGARAFTTANFNTIWDVAVAPEQAIRFEWIGNAEQSGTEPGPCNYGFDIPDPDDDSFRSIDGRGGWIGWAVRERMQESISFPRSEEGTTHDFYLKMRDISNNENTETHCHVRIRVANFSFARKFLIIDDLLQPAPKSGIPNSQTMDEDTDSWRWQVFSGLEKWLPPGQPVESLNVFNVFGEGDIDPAPTLPTTILDTLGMYQTLIWDAGASIPGLREAGREMLLSRYVGLGGNMLLTCYRGPVNQIEATNFPPGNEPKCANPDILTPGEYWNRFSFIWQFLLLHGCVEKPRGSVLETIEESLIGAEAIDPVYPDLRLDVPRWGSSTRGIRNYECLVPDPTQPGAIPWYERQPGMSLLYTAKTFRTTSRLAGRPVAWKTEPTAEELAEGSDRGRIVCFAFNPYYFEVTPVKGAMTLALNWLVEGEDL